MIMSLIFPGGSSGVPPPTAAYFCFCVPGVEGWYLGIISPPVFLCQGSVCLWGGGGGGGIPGNASLTDQFLWQPGNDSCSWNPVEGGVGREKNVHLLYFVSVFPVNDTALLPFPPPNPTPVCRCAEEEDCFPSHSK